MQNLILGCVLDLSDNPKTLTHLLQWEGKENCKISHFLCELWRTEEKENGVDRDENGIISSKIKFFLFKIFCWPFFSSAKN